MDAELAENRVQFQLRVLAAKAWRGALEFLTPSRCLTCQTPVQESASVCTECWQKLKLLDDPVCDVLGTPFAYDQGEGILSPAALADPPAWDRSRAAVIFDDQSKEFVHALKYRDQMEAGIFMARLMGSAGRKLIAEADVVVPVPLHYWRLWKRRFNQAAFLAQRIAKSAGKPFAPRLLIRHRATPPQVGLDAKERRKNVRKAFKVRGSLEGKCVLLIDDVRTTGATLSACTDVLKSAGAARVWVLTFALVNDPLKPHIEA
jgi:ComF family protein